jgi:ribose transport system ATP-binding protein
MVELARALADQARVLVMDEPTSALTGVEVEQLFATIARLVAAGVAIVYISHRMNEVFEIGHRVTVLRDGRNVATRLLADVTASGLVQMMANRDLPDQYPERRATRGRELLKVEGLSRRGTLHDINLSLHAGEILGIAGLVGADGRSWRERSSVRDPIDAAASRSARSCPHPTPAAAVRHGVGYLGGSQSTRLVLGLSVQRNIGLPNYRRPRSGVRTAAASATMPNG